MGILSVHTDKINLDYVVFYEDDPETIIHVKRLINNSVINLKNLKHIKIHVKNCCYYNFMVDIKVGIVECWSEIQRQSMKILHGSPFENILIKCHSWS